MVNTQRKPFSEVLPALRAAHKAWCAKKDGNHGDSLETAYLDVCDAIYGLRPTRRITSAAEAVALIDCIKNLNWELEFEHLEVVLRMLRGYLKKQAA